MKFEHLEFTDKEVKKRKKMTKRNPKQEGSNLFDCKPQSGLCPNNCNQCFYNRPGAFYVDVDKPHMPTVEEVGDSIMRVNCGHDSNIEREKVIKETEIYSKRFFNTSIPEFDFPAPVVFTANPQEEESAMKINRPNNLMFIRLRVSSTNLQFIKAAVYYYCTRHVPIVLTFMAYYDKKPDDNYTYQVRHVNSYWCPEPHFVRHVVSDMKQIGGRAVSACGQWCWDCRNCETYYYQTIKHMREAGK